MKTWALMRQTVSLSQCMHHYFHKTHCRLAICGKDSGGQFPNSKMKMRLLLCLSASLETLQRFISVRRTHKRDNRTHSCSCTHSAQSWWPSVSSQPSCWFHLNAGMALLLLLCNCSQAPEQPNCQRRQHREETRRATERWEGGGVSGGRPLSGGWKDNTF